MEILKKIQLTIGKRSKNNPTFSKLLCAIGEGRIEEIDFNNERVIPLQQFKSRIDPFYISRGNYE